MKFNSKIKILCEWGLHGLLNTDANVIIIVDILSFTTSVDIAVSKGAYIYPYQYSIQEAEIYAKQKNAILAKPRGDDGYSLSPYSLLGIPKNTHLILPSPNGSTLAFLAKNKAKHVLAGSLRNAASVAKSALLLGNQIAVIPAGEKWEDNSMRVAYEDLIGAGAIINQLLGEKTAEAKLAEEVFYQAKKVDFQSISQLKSGQELIAWGFERDITLACQYNQSNTVPYLIDDFFTNQNFI